MGSAARRCRGALEEALLGRAEPTDRGTLPPLRDPNGQAPLPAGTGHRRPEAAVRYRYYTLQISMIFIDIYQGVKFPDEGPRRPALCAAGGSPPGFLTGEGCRPPLPRCDGPELLAGRPHATCWQGQAGWHWHWAVARRPGLLDSEGAWQLPGRT